MPETPKSPRLNKLLNFLKKKSKTRMKMQPFYFLETMCILKEFPIVPISKRENWPKKNYITNSKSPKTSKDNPFSCLEIMIGTVELKVWKNKPDWSPNTSMRKKAFYLEKTVELKD